MTEQLRECDRCGWNFLTEDVERLCTHCTSKLEEQVGQCDHGPEVMCRECHPEAFHHISGMQETIRARDKSIAEYSTKVRMLERSNQDLRQAVQLARSTADEEAQRNAALFEERNEWKAKAERVETEYQNALQDGSICPDPDEHATVNILQGQQRYYADVRKERDQLRKAHQSWWDGWTEHVESYHPGYVGVFPPKLVPRSEIDADDTPSTHWCCMHMRWETPEGKEA